MFKHEELKLEANEMLLGISSVHFCSTLVLATDAAVVLSSDPNQIFSAERLV